MCFSKLCDISWIKLIPDKLYWRKGFQLLGNGAEDVTPVFLKEVASDVFLVGKSINLLQLINPEVNF